VAGVIVTRLHAATGREIRMLLYLLTLVVVALGVGVFAHYNPGSMDITVRTYHFTGIPDWEVVAAAAGVPLVPYLLHSIYSSVRIRLLRRATGRYSTGRTFADLPASTEPQPTPKRSWNTSRD
jgi:hypothetical protein